MTTSRALGVTVVGASSGDLSHHTAGKLFVRRCVNPREALRDASADVIVLCSSLRDRSYWLQEVAGAGKHAMCAPPLSASFRRLQRLTRLYADAGLRLACFSDAGVPALSRWLATREHYGRTGAILYLRLRVSIPRSDL